MWKERRQTHLSCLPFKLYVLHSFIHFLFPTYSSTHRGWAQAFITLNLDKHDSFCLSWFNSGRRESLAELYVPLLRTLRWLASAYYLRHKHIGLSKILWDTSPTLPSRSNILCQYLHYLITQEFSRPAKITGLLPLYAKIVFYLLLYMWALQANTPS